MNELRLKYCKFKYRRANYCLIYAPFQVLRGAIYKKHKKFVVVIRYNLSDREKSIELHNLLKDKKKFEHGGRRNVPSWLS